MDGWMCLGMQVENIKKQFLLESLENVNKNLKVFFYCLQ